MTKPRVRILYCPGCRWLPRAAWQAQELLTTFERELGEVALVPAARGTYDPAYLNYTMGKLMIRKLRNDWVAANYPDATGTEGWKEFHDEFLSYGGPNIPQVRQAMMGEEEARAVFGE